jgi:hypothetical protein
MWPFPLYAQRFYSPLISQSYHFIKEEVVPKNWHLLDNGLKPSKPPIDLLRRRGIKYPGISVHKFRESDR